MEEYTQESPEKVKVKYNLCFVCQHTPLYCRCPKTPEDEVDLGEIILREQIEEFESDVLSDIWKHGYK